MSWSPQLHRFHRCRRRILTRCFHILIVPLTSPSASHLLPTPLPCTLLSARLPPHPFQVLIVCVSLRVYQESLAWVWMFSRAKENDCPSPKSIKTIEWILVFFIPIRTIWIISYCCFSTWEPWHFMSRKTDLRVCKCSENSLRDSQFHFVTYFCCYFATFSLDSHLSLIYSNRSNKLKCKKILVVLLF